ncbi:MAG: putative Fe-S cluster assembly protein SufT [Opitutaceae bacterium]|jgi:probable FeS assembly SUF system protein SufT|nr:putative Fe-S cluster assembly protein SufT [Opitutaceae bacterium]
MSSETTLTRECAATMIPSGQVVNLPAGTRVFITQTLGGNVTVRTEGGLFRIAAADATAIAGHQATAEAAEPAAGEFSEEAVWGALRTCFDPEIPVNIVDLGLIYDLAVESGSDGRRVVDVKMTLTAPGCGMGPVIAEDARQKIARLPSVAEARVHIVWDPQWTPQMISESGRKALGLE